MAIGGPNVDNIYVYNNVFHQSVRITAQTKTIVKNNIFWGNYMNTDNDRFSWPELNYEMENNLFSLDAWLNRGLGSIPAVLVTNLLTEDIESNFVNSDQFDFRLRAGAQVIDAGAALHAEGFVTDYNGNPRPQGVAWDIGAYELCASAGCVMPPPPPTTLPGGGGGHDDGDTEDDSEAVTGGNTTNDFAPFSNVFYPLKAPLSIDLNRPASNATLVVYDKKGGEVRNLTPTGSRFTWDGRNSSGEIVASGTYLVVLTQGKKTKKKKVVVIK
jgi:hypothetical protein